MRSEEARIKRSIVVTRKHDHALSMLNSKQPSIVLVNVSGRQYPDFRLEKHFFFFDALTCFSFCTLLSIQEQPNQ